MLLDDDMSQDRKMHRGVHHLMRHFRLSVGIIIRTMHF